VAVKTVLVTGASTGIGEACALHLDRLGHRVYAGVRTKEHADDLRRHGSDRIVPVFLDVTDQDQVNAVAARIAGDSGRLEGVVNNAGIAKGGPLEYLPLAAWREQLDVNVVGQVAVTKAALPLIRPAKGRIVFIGSISGKVATMMLGPYCASKFALEAIGASLRHELHPWGISVSVIEPGAIRTAIWEKGRRDADEFERDLPAEARAQYAKHITAIRNSINMQDRRGADPGNVARAVEHALFARRPKTRYLVGTDAKVQSALVRWLPDRPREAIIRRFAGP
jgi:NAD(P)-dependent dehydrogenase (short-subunit alcohol dehydrogenase family)